MLTSVRSQVVLRAANLVDALCPNIAVCPVNTFKPLSGNASCIACPANAVAAAGQSTACTCLAGYAGTPGTSSNPGPCNSTNHNTNA